LIRSFAVADARNVRHRALVSCHRLNDGCHSERSEESGQRMTKSGLETRMLRLRLSMTNHQIIPDRPLVSVGDAVDVAHSYEEDFFVCDGGGGVAPVAEVVDGEYAELGAGLDDVALSGVGEE